MIVVGHRQSHKIGSVGAVSDGIRGGRVHSLPVVQKTVNADRLLIAPRDGLAEQGDEEQDSMHGK